MTVSSRLFVGRAQLHIAFIIGAIFSATAGAAFAALPNSGLTPGDVDERDRATICMTGAAEQRRSVSYATRDRVYLAYGIPRGHRKGLYRIDHLVPLELGGSNRASNLWPQPYADSKLKDRVERQLHNAVCNGSITLESAQRAIANDWHTAVQSASRP